MTPGTRILAVDDDPPFLEMLTEILTVQGYEVITAENAAVAFIHLAVAAPDVLLLDIGMPGLDGAAALSRIHVSNPGLPVIMLTGNDNVEVTRDALELGAFGYVTKPFDSLNLARLIEAAIAHRG